MSSIDIISMSLRNLFKRKLRSFLTIFGVVIGTAAIVVMISLGIAVNEGFEERINQMGDIRILNVRNPNGGGGGMMYSSGGSSGSGTSTTGEKISLNEKAVEKFKKIPKVTAVTPISQISLTALSGKFVTWMDIKGIDPTSMADFEYKLAEGELLKGDKYGIVYGTEVPFNFYNPNDRNYRRNIDWDNRTPNVDVLNDKVEMSYEDGYGYTSSTPIFEVEVPAEEVKQKPKPYKLKGNGILAPMGWEYDYYCFMDIAEVQKIKLAQQKYRQNEGIRWYGNNSFSASEYDTVMVKCDDIDSVEPVMGELKALGFYVDSYYIDYLNELQETSRQNQIFLGAIGAVSLFVAAIGITNTMIMAIYERTREIGIMKVIGSSIKDIKKLFLLEAAMIGFIGGTAGIVLSLGISVLLNKTGLSIAGSMGGMGGSKVSIIPMWLCFGAMGFSSAIGLASGYFPARRAMKLSALAAIRSE